MGNYHARLGPSGASTWLTCQGSVLLVESMPRSGSSVYAEEGTCAHDLAELKARHFIRGDTTPEEYQAEFDEWIARWPRYTTDPEAVVEFGRHTDGYVEFIREEMSHYPGSVLLLEQRVSPGVPECDGTADAVIISPVHIGVIDFKYGAGVRVDIEENAQLRLYGLGALEDFGFLSDPEVVRLSIYQPRLPGGHAPSVEETPQALREWRDNVVIPAAEAALKPGAPFAPSESNCRWCDASGRCPAQLEAVFSEPFEEPATLGPAEIAEALSRAPLVSAWLKALEVAALSMAYEEETDIPGWKVVQSGGIRKIVDQEGALEVLRSVGWDFDKVAPRKIAGIGVLEKLLGKADFATLLNDYVEKTTGRPSLAPDTDPRPAINRNVDAAAVFTQNEHEEE